MAHAHLRQELLRSSTPLNSSGQSRIHAGSGLGLCAPTLTFSVFSRERERERSEVILLGDILDGFRGCLGWEAQAPHEASQEPR